MMRYEKRRQQLRKLLSESKADGILVTNFTNVQYLTGFTGDDSYLLVTDTEELLLSDPRYEQQLSEECPQVATLIRKPSEPLLPVTGKALAKRQLAKLVVEGNSMTLNQYDQLLALVGNCRLVAGDGEVESLRAIKDRQELEQLRRAVDIAQRAFTSVRALLRADQTEQDIANELERLIRSLGGAGCSFDPIVAVGPRSALPHARPGNSRIGDHPFVLLDWGAVYRGYRSDLTRVLWTSKIPAKFARIYETVRAAQAAAIGAIKPGVLASQVDAEARKVIQQAGMGKRFNHGLGHGVGLDIHESPRLGKNQERPLTAGMVVTVEPGVYYPGFGGVRIEDDVLVTADGCEVLSSLGTSLAENHVQLIR